MKTQWNILIAFILNLAFSVFEMIGGVVTGSVAIISDAVHDMGDALSIGVSWYLEKKSKRQPDEEYTFGYARYSVIGSVITTLILLFGSVMVIYNAAIRLMDPKPIHYDGMILFAIVGVGVNLCAVLVTRKGESLNQKAVNLHMLEDVLGWVVVFIGAIVMRFTDIRIIDPILSIGVAAFILVNALRNLKESVSLFLEKTPEGIRVGEIREHIEEIEGVLEVHHIHIWSTDGVHNYATMHIVTNSDSHAIKEKVRDELAEHGIGHATLELEWGREHCDAHDCVIVYEEGHLHHGHHHHHHEQKNPRKNPWVFHYRS
jgi:cobalt-zinc-cadmium efflux system protein